VLTRTARGWLRPFRGLIREIAKFGVIGVLAYLMTVAISNWLRFGAPHLGPITSLGIAMIIAATFSYFANRHWTWKDKQRRGIGREYGMFILLSAIGLALTELPVAVSEYIFGLHGALAYNISGNLIGTAIGTVWRFWSFKRWVFLEPEPARSTDTAEAALI
jgi:putative flippase GtrA